MFLSTFLLLWRDSEPNTQKNINLRFLTAHSKTVLNNFLNWINGRTLLRSTGVQNLY